MPGKLSVLTLCVFTNLLSTLFFHGCSIKKIAINSLADSLSGGGMSVFSTDDDPELIGDALPFGLKTMESLLQSTPEHKGLLISLASGFVQYGHAFVLYPVNLSESVTFEETRWAKNRAKRLFLRARDYGLRALEVDYNGFKTSLQADATTVLTATHAKDVPALYWTGAAWASAISVSKNDMALVGDLPIVQALMERALALDEDWNEGALHDFFIVFDAGRSEAEGGGIQKAEVHYERAMTLNQGRSVGPKVSLAESVCVKQQDRERFRLLLTEVLEIDVDRHLKNRLSNILAQRKARYLLRHIDDFFL